MHFEYLNLPPVPSEYINDVYYAIQHNPNIFAKKFFTDYKIFDATQQLKDFTAKIFDFEHVTRVQVLTYHIPIHRDINRDQAYNYIIETGGDNVLTCFYTNEFLVLDKINIKVNQWHRIDTQIYHSVENISTTRIALTVHQHRD